MGKLDGFAKLTFAEDTPRVTGGSAAWHRPPEVRLERVQADGYLRVLRPEGLVPLARLWPAACDHDEVLVEIKRAGDHVGIGEI
ncbi:hypothetical protein [Sorangium sp. So ce117]|uniref:hypothetical protein n=1 Tax=Sorangium sp. So ce117 TaxID=3133277 RepID=UPI003F631EA9